MFSKHVTKDLSAYCHGELANEQSRQIAEHLIGCNHCRAEFEEIKLGVKLAKHLPQLSAPDSLWLDLQNRLDRENNEGRIALPQPTRFPFKVRWPAFAGVAAGLFLLVGFGALWLYTREARPFWEVARLNGTPTIGSSRLNGKGRLAVGQWLETDSDSRAEIEVSSIGQVEIAPNTRVRLVATKATEHRLELAHGKMSARIWAPPRLFFVDTPSSVAADLGCAYTLEVDDAGAGVLHVTSGWVALQLKERESLVPAGASCATRQGVGPGTPYFDDASLAFRSALREFDFNLHEATAVNSLQMILSEARPRDTLTLWHLLYRVEGRDRELVFQRMAALSPLPNGVTREAVLALDEDMLHLWKGYLERSWSIDSNPKKLPFKI